MGSTPPEDALLQRFRAPPNMPDATNALPDSAATTPINPMMIRDFQKMIHDRYYATDSARGAAKTFLWFSEEVGELAHALAKLEKGTPDRANLEEEFADVLAWLTTLANIAGVDLEQAIHAKYIADGGPEGTK